MRTIECYASLTAQVVSMFRTVLESIRLEAMFSESPEADAAGIFEAAEEMRKLAADIKKSAGVISSLGQTSAYITMVEELLPRSEEVVKEFRKRMDTCIQFLEGFRLTDERYYSYDRGQITDRLNRFYRTYNNVLQYNRIYEFVGL